MLEPCPWPRRVCAATPPLVPVRRASHAARTLCCSRALLPPRRASFSASPCPRVSMRPLPRNQVNRSSPGSAPLPCAPFWSRSGLGAAFCLFGSCSLLSGTCSPLSWHACFPFPCQAARCLELYAFASLARPSLFGSLFVGRPQPHSTLMDGIPLPEVRTLVTRSTA